jgi:hypothetical protein
MNKFYNSKYMFQRINVRNFSKQVNRRIVSITKERLDILDYQSLLISQGLTQV